MAYLTRKTAILLIGAILLASCTSAPIPTPAPALPTQAQTRLMQPPSTKAPVAQATPLPSVPKVKLLAYNYKTKDVGDGWSEGTVELAFENTSGEFVGGETVDVTGATLETQEGKTYPVTVYRIEPNMALELKQIDFSKLPKVVPPRFRWTRLGRLGERFNLHFLKFRVATAAHPSRIVFPKRPDWSVDLASVTQTSLTFPAEASVVSAKPISALAGKVLADDPAGLLVTLDGLGLQRDQTLQLQYTIVNRDKLDSRKANIAFPIQAFFFGDGAVWPKTPGLGTETVEAGPGQTKQGALSLGYIYMDRKCDPNVYMLIQEGGKNDIYRLDVCK